MLPVGPNSYWNQTAYHHPVPFYHRAPDSYQPPVGLHTTWTGIQISIDNRGTQLLIDAINTGAGATAIGAALTAAGVVTSVAALPLGVLSGLLALESSSISIANNRGGNKGVVIEFGLPTPFNPYALPTVRPRQ